MAENVHAEAIQVLSGKVCELALQLKRAADRGDAAHAQDLAQESLSLVNTIHFLERQGAPREGGNLNPET